MNIEFDAQDLEKIEDLKTHYPQQKAALMPVLWMAQRKFGWLSEEVIKYVAGILNLPYSQVYGVVSFYTMYYKKPMGRFHIQVCTNVACMLRDGDKIFDHISGLLGIGHNGKTDDGLFSLEEVECMGACGEAPVVVVNEDYYGNLDIQKVDTLLDGLKSR